MRGPLTRVLDDEAEVFRRIILDDADGLADVLDQDQGATLFKDFGEMFATQKFGCLLG